MTKLKEMQENYEKQSIKAQKKVSLTIEA